MNPRNTVFKTTISRLRSAKVWNYKFLSDILACEKPFSFTWDQLEKQSRKRDTSRPLKKKIRLMWKCVVRSSQERLNKPCQTKLPSERLELPRSPKRPKMLLRQTIKLPQRLVGNFAGIPQNSGNSFNFWPSEFGNLSFSNFLRHNIIPATFYSDQNLFPP